MQFAVNGIYRTVRVFVNDESGEFLSLVRLLFVVLFFKLDILSKAVFVIIL